MRKILDDLNLKDMYLYEEDTCGRQEIFNEQLQKYGFDVRETWDMRFTFFVWLYERLTMYNGIKPVDTTFHKITINERTENLQFWIDTLLEMTKELLIAYN